MPPQEAMQADPNEIMQNLQRMDKIDDKKLSTLLDNQGSKDGVAVLGDASISGVMILSNNNEDESVAPESIGDSVVPARRIFGGKRHGYGQNAPIKVSYSMTKQFNSYIFHTRFVIPFYFLCRWVMYCPLVTR